MVEDEKGLFMEHGFMPFRQDADSNVVAWKRDIVSRNMEIYININPDQESYDISCKENNVQKTIYNDADDPGTALEFVDSWLADNGYFADIDAVKPVFNADPLKIAEDIDELERSIDGDEYDAMFPDKEAHIAEMTQDIQNGNTELLSEYLQALTLQEMEAEQKQAQYLLARLTEYKAGIAAYNYLANAEELEEGNYNAIDGIIGNSAPKDPQKVNIKSMIEDNRRRLGLSGDTPDRALSPVEMEQRNII